MALIDSIAYMHPKRNAVENHEADKEAHGNHY